MRIEAVEIRNFRKLASVRLDFSKQTTLLVGANNSGKTSALIALRSFLKQGISAFSKNDLTLSRWQEVNDIGAGWAVDPSVTLPGTWAGLLPSLDVWLHVEDDEVHRVSPLIPTLDWTGGRVGVRFALEPKDEENLARTFHDAWTATQALKAAWRLPAETAPVILSSASTNHNVGHEAVDYGADHVSAVQTDQPLLSAPEPRDLSLWPDDLIDFLSKYFQTHLVLRHYVLDPEKFQPPMKDCACVQDLPRDSEPLASNPLADIVLIDEINAQRGLGDAGEHAADASTGRISDTARLSRQLSDYYTKHLDPAENPGPEDLHALQTIAVAQEDFDARLKQAFKVAFDEMAGLSYPGVTDPRIRVASKLSAAESLRHESAVSFELKGTGGLATSEMYLPEGQNGLGYQNLISMVFRLMSFRDRWLHVGKAAKPMSDASIQPIHLVLVEEPEAHLHVQVQQVFAKKAFDVLRNHIDLLDKSELTTQLVISTHSSHIAHELPYESLRYFRRLEAGANGVNVPTSNVINVDLAYGTTQDTQRFVQRYLRVQHADIFFADALILVEGSAEKMLVPLFIKHRHPALYQAYVTMLEIGGSHAHRLQPLIDALKIPTLVVTDLDPKFESGPNAPTQRGVKQISGNPTLKNWSDLDSDVDSLLEAHTEAKIKKGDDQYAVRFAYQTAVTVSLDTTTEEALPSTFEDALAFENVSFFRTLAGTGLTRKFRDILTTETDVKSAAAKLHAALTSGSKAEFALDIMMSVDFEKMTPPRYIDEGLTWLEERMQKQELTVNGDTDAE
ncbi:AAA family ATPase [Subtercola vilae]|uniref:ATP-dependent endonuclease n=1 Tax=Subtercola vilae TaxID=2056433 RepID=A0A4T2BQQ6_9MICO|nr:AAA family ATPase [Subtercola vilae]TIH33905.1 ATP-dependent endonuclease [Subtercola vilae]